MYRRLLSKFDDDTRGVIRGSSIAFSARIGGMLCSYAFILVLAHACGAYGVGIYSVAVAIVTIASLPASLGFRVSILRFVPEYVSSDKAGALLPLYRNMLKIMIPVSVMLGVLIFLASDLLANKAFDDASYASGLRLSAIAIPLFTIGIVNVEAIRGFKNPALSESLRDISVPLVALSLLLLLRPYVGINVLPVASYVCGVCAMFALSTCYVARRLTRLHRTHPVECPMRPPEMVKVSLPMMLGELATLLMGRIDILMLGILAKPEDVGVYSIVFKLGVLPILIPAAVATIMAPKISELHWSGKHEDLKCLTRLSCRLMFWSSLPVVVILLLAPRFWLGLFGDEFSSGMLALVFVTFCPFITSASGFVGTFLNMTGKQTVYRNVIVTAVALNILLNYLLIPWFGVAGAAAASLATTLFWNIAGVVYVKRVFGINLLYIPLMPKK